MKDSMKKMLSVISASALTLSLAACGNAKAEDLSDHTAAKTLTGEITGMEDTSVTLQLGGGMPGGQMPGQPDGETPPEKPEADNSSATDQSTPSAPPELPDGGGNRPNGRPAPPTGSAPTKPSDNGTSDSGTTPPEPPQGNGTSGDSTTPPEPPQGSELPDTGTTPPEPPKNDGNAPSDAGLTPPDGMGDLTTSTSEYETVTLDFSNASITKDGQTATISDLNVGDFLTVELSDDQTVVSAEVLQMGPQGGSGGFGGSGQVTQGTSATTISEDGVYSDTSYTSTGDDENALRVDGATVTLDGITVDKSAGATSNTEDGDFYGMNAALLATNGATVTITNAKVSSSAQNGNGVFSYGSGTTVNISDSTITTTADNSGGIQTTGGGTTNASNLTVNTSGNSSAAIRSDRGGGTVKVDGGSYTSNGYNSPAVYSTANITVQNAELTANNSEALVIEGKNSITLKNCDVTGNMSDTKGSSSAENVHNVMIYQSMSGDADVGTSAFSMTGGTLTGQNGDLFYITNTHCVMNLSGVTLENQDQDGVLLRAVGNSASHGWGTAGSNGAQVELTADDQTLNGDIVVDTISTLDLHLTNGSVFTGTLNIVENAEGGTAVENNAVVTIDSGCTWELTGDCTVSSLTNNGTIHFNGHTITLADGTVLK